MRFALLIGLFLTIQTAYAAEQPTLARVTTYWREEGQFRAAWNGARLRNGHCAVDPKKIPYGSRIQLGDEELIAVDTGPAVVSRKAARLSGHNAAERNAVVVDRYFETKSQAVAWEKSHPHFMKMRVVRPEPDEADVEKRPVNDKNSPLDTNRRNAGNQQATGHARGYSNRRLLCRAFSSGCRGQPPAMPVDTPVASWTPQTLSQGAAAGHSIGYVCHK